MHLKHGQIRFGCIKQLNLLVVLGWVELGPNLSTCNWFGWVSQLMGWVGSGRTKWTNGQLWASAVRRAAWRGHRQRLSTACVGVITRSV